MLLALTACVNVVSKNQFISNTSNTSGELQSCETVEVMNQPTENIQGLNPDNIAFLNWNIYKGNGDDWQNDLSKFAKNHDVMTIQEAMLSDEMTTLLQTYGFNWIMNTAFYLNGTATGVMNVASTIAIYSCGFKVDEPLIGIPKSALVSYYLIDGSDEKLLVANIHGINFTLGVSSYSDQLDKLYDAIKHHDGPMIVAGDFNSWSDSRMAVVDQLVERLELSELEYSVNNKTHVFGNAIDHVFYRQLEPLKYQVQQVSSSDHNPISVNFRVQSSAF
ncbi:MAG: endonuclease/exonuclease/phosphatase family protein [Gammaproteobacteria bacterium]|nr:MAG: endonuclease/exonuclease/phosphatase family protein [Gammaproteobacteria bacterium]